MWWFRLSLRMGRTVDELKAGVTADQLQKYKTMALVDGPWWLGASESICAADIRYTIACAMVGDKAPDWDAFYRTWDEKPKPKLKLDPAAASQFLLSLVPPDKRKPAA